MENKNRPIEVSFRDPGTYPMTDHLDRSSIIPNMLRTVPAEIPAVFRTGNGPGTGNNNE